MLKLLKYMIFLVAMLVLCISLVPCGIFLSLALEPKKTPNHVKRVGLALDQLANVIGKYFFDLTLIKSNSNHKFGAVDETISSVIGKNQKENSLTRFGYAVNYVLNMVDPNHSLNSIEEDEGL